MHVALWQTPSGYRCFTVLPTQVPTVDTLELLCVYLSFSISEARVPCISLFAPRYSCCFGRFMADTSLSGVGEGDSVDGGDHGGGGAIQYKQLPLYAAFLLFRCTPA